MSRASSLAPLRQRDFAWYYASRSVNQSGSVMAGIALTFAVLDLTGSASDLGIVMAARMTPMVVLLLWGGVIADRFSRSLVIQVSNVVSGLTQAAIAALVLTHTAQIWQIVVLSLVNGISSAFSFPALASVMPQLVPRDQLQQANALMSISRNALMVLGPSVGALIVVTVGSGWALAVDAATWLVAAGLLLPVRLPPVDRSHTSAGVLADLREGWGYFVGTTWLWVVVLAFGAINALTGVWLVVGPAVAQDTIGRQGWGLVLSAEAIGLLLTALILLRVRLSRPLLTGMVGTAVGAVPMITLGLDPQLALLVVIALIAGMGSELFGLGWNLAMQEHVPEEMLSRASSYDALGSLIATPLGTIAAGPLALAVGDSTTLVGAGVLYLAICAAVLMSRAVRTLPRADAQLPSPSHVPR
ncbi:MAG TPA: MFS transporter [Nocardioides sp.]|uniref:MFS transporter n=1 Tax=Nocardioides sp. TaxID=35761 RepID=UPI002F412DC6